MQTRSVLKKLNDALAAAKMGSAGFSLTPGGFSSEADTAAIIEATKLYRESWIIGPLVEAIAEIERSAKR